MTLMQRQPTTISSYRRSEAHHETRRFLLRSCPRCHGDLFSHDDASDPEFECLQCGRSARLSQVQDSQACA